MRKLSILAFAALLVVAFTLPAAAIEHQFGGYWRTRFIAQENFAVAEVVTVDAEAGTVTDNNVDISRVDTRTRLYYTAKFNDNFKFVNKFEMDAVWGDQATYGRVEADRISVEVKNSYADFNTGNTNWRVGAKGEVIADGFILWTDASGITINHKVSDATNLGFAWIRYNEGGWGNLANSLEDANDGDFDGVFFVPTMNFGEAMTLRVDLGYIWSKRAGDYEASQFPNGQDLNLWLLGANFSGSADALSYSIAGWFQGGDIEAAREGALVVKNDFAGYAFQATLAYDLGGSDIHGQFVYASGDDDPTDGDYSAFYNPEGASVYWSEILGYGTFDQNSPLDAYQGADEMTNLMFFNIGAGFSPMENLSLSADLWYAQWAEDNAFGENDLGTEIDLAASYAVMEGLSLDVVGAYLWAGDGLSPTGKAEDDPWELGAMLSLSF